jgi:hypothetical protein
LTDRLKGPVDHLGIKGHGSLNYDPMIIEDEKCVHSKISEYKVGFRLISKATKDEIVSFFSNYLIHIITHRSSQKEELLKHLNALIVSIIESLIENDVNKNNKNFNEDGMLLNENGDINIVDCRPKPYAGDGIL